MLFRSGKMTVRRSFELSLNTGISLAVTKAYGADPKKFVAGLKRFHLHETTGVMIPGEAIPTLRSPGEKGWSGVSMPWMSIGYEVALTPLQTLTFYNAVANNGKMMQPQFVDHISRNGKVIEKFAPKVIDPKICSEATLDIVHGLLQGVVDSGTATNLRAAHFAIAGKTGTAEKPGADGKYDPNVLFSSFAAIFPARAPRYVIVLALDEPQRTSENANLATGGAVAAPAVGRVVARITPFLSTPNANPPTERRSGGDRKP